MTKLSSIYHATSRGHSVQLVQLIRKAVLPARKCFQEEYTASHPVKQVKRNSILFATECAGLSNRTSLIQEWRITTKKIVPVTVLGFGPVSASRAVETVNIREHVNNAQVPAHQIQPASVPSVVQGEISRMAGMNQYKQVIIAHEIMNNGSAETHQKMAENHQKMMGSIAVNDTRPSVSFAATNGHERTAVAHKIMNNGQSGACQTMTEAHHRMINAS